MSKAVVLELPEEVYAAVEKVARFNAKGTSQWLMDVVSESLPKRDERLRRHFGAVDLGKPTGIDNEGIDADLARAYGYTYAEDAG